MSQVSPRKIVRIADGNADIPGYIQNDVINLPFSWKKLEDLFLTAVFSYIFLHMPVEQRKIVNILPLIRDCARDSADAATGINPFDKLREQCPNSYALAKYIEFREASRNIFGDYYESILISCVMRLIIFDSVIYTNVASVTDKDDLKIEDFADDKFAIFIVVPSKEDVDNIYDIVSNMLFCQITRCIDRYF